MIKAYASYFVSYLLANLKNTQDIHSIILFGSVAKDEATKESDVDMFIEVENKKIEKEIEKKLEDFYKSREALFFKTRDIDNKINLIMGKLDKWKELKSSIESTGLVLYGNYISSNISGKKYSIIYWNKIGKNRGAFLNRVYGFSIKKKRYRGLIEKFNGSKIGKSSIIIPVEYREEIIKLLKEYRVNAKILDVYM